jgi:hypothetical protein
VRLSRSIAAGVASIVLAAAAAGCGVGPGESDEGTASLRVTRDHGAELLVEATATDPTESETVVRVLDREADIETSYGGNFVTSIEGVEGTIEGGRSLDWYYYVNGIWSPVGAGEATVHADDRIWWDYRDWTSAYRVPAVVGSYPEPFRSGLNGEQYPTELVCLDAAERSGACETVERALTEAGAELTSTTLEESDPKQSLRVLVGTWGEVRADPTARTMEGGPGQSGVYAKPAACAGSGLWSLDVLDAEGESAGGSSDASWVAALQQGDDRPTWVVAASIPDGLDDAAAMLDEETLRDRFAVASFGAGAPSGLPAAEGVEGAEGPAGSGASCR